MQTVMQTPAVAGKTTKIQASKGVTQQVLLPSSPKAVVVSQKGKSLVLRYPDETVVELLDHFDPTNATAQVEFPIGNAQWLTLGQDVGVADASLAAQESLLYQAGDQTALNLMTLANPQLAGLLASPLASPAMLASQSLGWAGSVGLALGATALAAGAGASGSGTVPSSTTSASTAPDQAVVDTEKPLIAIAPIAQDNVVNAQERSQGITVSGQTTAEDGQRVTITWAGVVKTGWVQNKAWSVVFSATEIPLDATLSPITAVVSDHAGNVSDTVTRTVRIDSTSPKININNIQEGLRINAAQKSAGLYVQGTTDAESGQWVTLRFGNTTRSVLVSDGAWQTTLSAAEFPSDGVNTLSVQVSDAAGNLSNTSAKAVVVDSIAPTLSINTLAVDGVLTTAEKTAQLQVTGTTNAEDGQVVSISLAGVVKSAVVRDGAWSATYSAAEIPAEAGAYALAATVSDVAGNPSATAHQRLLVDTAKIDASTLGVDANSINDQTAVIQAAILAATAQGKELVFEPGVYYISGQIKLPDQFLMSSAVPGGAVFKIFPPLTDSSYAIFTAGGYGAGSTVKSGSFYGFTLDGPQFEAYGNATGVTVEKNIFMDTVAPLPAHSGYGEAAISSVYLGHGQFVLKDNVFLNSRANATQNVAAIKTYFTKNTEVHGNIIGGVNDSSAMQTLLSDATRQLLEVAKAYKPTLNVHDSGYFTSGMYLLDGDYNLALARNAFVLDDSPSVIGDDSLGYFRDHVIYGKQFLDLQVIGNYFTGSAPDAAGQVKLRNADGLLFAGNTLEDVDLITYAYDNAPLKVDHLSNVYVVLNQFINGLFSYWENEVGLKAPAIHVFDNLIEAINFLPKAWSGQNATFYANNNVNAAGEQISANAINSTWLSQVVLHRPEWASYFAGASSPYIALSDQALKLSDLIELAVMPSVGQTLSANGSDPQLLRVLDQVPLTLGYPGSTQEMLIEPRLLNVPLDSLAFDGGNHQIVDIAGVQANLLLATGETMAAPGYIFSVKQGSKVSYLLKLQDDVGSTGKISAITLGSKNAVLTVDQKVIDDNLDVQLSTPSLTMRGLHQTVVSEDGVVNAAEASVLQVAGTALLPDGDVVSVTFSDGVNTVTAHASVQSGKWQLPATDIRALNNGSVTVTAEITDATAGAIRATQTVIKDTRSIDLADGNALLNGQLIGRMDANGASYYMYDGNADQLGGLGDPLSRSQLSGLFNQNLTGTETGALSDTYRYARVALAAGGAVHLGLLANEDRAGLEAILAGTSSSQGGWLYNGTATNMHLAGSDLGTSTTLGDRWQPGFAKVIDIASDASKYMTVLKVLSVSPLLMEGMNNARVGDDGVINSAEVAAVRVKGSAAAADGQAIVLTFSQGAQTVSATAYVAAGQWSIDPVNLSALSDGEVTVTAQMIDAQGVSHNETQTVYKNTATFDLASSNTLLTGQLVHRIEANGKSYYLYDGDANAVGGLNDPLTRSQLVSVFTQNADGSSNGSTSDIYRYGSFALARGGMVRLALLSQEDTAGLFSAFAGRTGSQAGWLYEGNTTSFHLAGSAAGTDPALGDRWTPNAGTPVSDVASPLNKYMVALELVDYQPILLQGMNTAKVSDDGVVNALEARSLQVKGSADVPDGQSVTITFTDGVQILTATASVSSGQWVMPALNVSSLNDGAVTVSASIIDAQGTSHSQSQSFVKDTRVWDLAASNALLTGQLIHRVDANGKTYFLYDHDANGAGGVNDPLTRSQLMTAFNQNLDGTASGTLSDTYRYAQVGLSSGESARLGLLSQSDLAALLQVFAGKSTSQAGWVYELNPSTFHLAGTALGTDAAVGDRWAPQNNAVYDVASNSNRYMTVVEWVSPAVL